MIFMLAGTSDARNLALALQSAGYAVTATVVTDSAATSLAQVGLPHLVGRLTAEEMAALITERGDRLVVDASHPFAEEASKNAMAAAKVQVFHISAMNAQMSITNIHSLQSLKITRKQHN